MTAVYIIGFLLFWLAFEFLFTNWIMRTYGVCSYGADMIKSHFKTNDCQCPKCKAWRKQDK